METKLPQHLSENTKNIQDYDAVLLGFSPPETGRFHPWKKTDLFYHKYIGENKINKSQPLLPKIPKHFQELKNSILQLTLIKHRHTLPNTLVSHTSENTQRKVTEGEEQHLAHRSQYCEKSKPCSRVFSWHEIKPARAQGYGKSFVPVPFPREHQHQSHAAPKHLAFRFSLSTAGNRITKQRVWDKDLRQQSSEASATIAKSAQQVSGKRAAVVLDCLLYLTGELWCELMR